MDLWTPQGMHHIDDAGERLQRFANSALERGREGQADDSRDKREMRLNRRVAMRANAALSGGYSPSGPSMSFATGRPRDLFFYWRQNNWPFEVDKEEELQRARTLCRLLYLTHPIVASAIDIFAKLPLTGLELTCKSEDLVAFHTDLFFERLGYEQFLIDFGKSYWLLGEALPLGQFNETLGVWEDDELINPNDVDVIKSPFLKEPRFEMRLPEVLRTILDTREPRWEFEILTKSYPELMKFTGQNQKMPVSNILMKQVAFKGDLFHPRGLPILMRGFRAIMQEEMLNCAQDAIADRLYTPLILARLGASATDLGTAQPWIPNEEDLQNFEEALDVALSADFRVLTHHFALQMDSVFGRETMPNLDADFERLEGRILQIFGMSKTLLSGAGQGETYAADALNRDLLGMLLSVYQRELKRFVKDRMLVVAEAQEHYDYEERNGMKYPIMEEILEVDEESGEQRIVQQPKLLVPELKLKAMDFSDEEMQRQLVEALKASGVVVSDRTRLTNIPIEFDDELEKAKEEQIDKAVATQETRRDTYKALRDNNLPIPDDLKADFEPKAQGSGQNPAEQAGQEQPPLPNMAMEDAASSTAINPQPEDYAAAEQEGIDPNAGAAIIPLPRGISARPPESDEMRANMPKPASLQDIEAASEEELRTGKVRSRLVSGPRHIGMRRYAKVKGDEPLEEESG